MFEFVCTNQEKFIQAEWIQLRLKFNRHTHKTNKMKHFILEQYFDILFCCYFKFKVNERNETICLLNQKRALSRFYVLVQAFSLFCWHININHFSIRAERFWFYFNCLTFRCFVSIQSIHLNSHYLRRNELRYFWWDFVFMHTEIYSV